MKDFGHIRSDLVNTLTGMTVPKQPLKWFWEGFSNVSQRLIDQNGTPMLLKLKVEMSMSAQMLVANYYSFFLFSCIFSFLLVYKIK